MKKQQIVIATGLSNNSTVRIKYGSWAQSSIFLFFDFCSLKKKNKKFLSFYLLLKNVVFIKTFFFKCL